MKKIHFIMISLVILLNACQKSDYLPIDDQHPKGNLSERLWMIKKVSSDIETKANAPMDKTWWPGQTIKIKFLNGSSSIQEKVKTYAAEWLDYANLTFEYVDKAEYADVKIGFDMNDSYIAYSTIGIDCKKVSQNEASLHFVYLEAETDETIIRGEILRAFGLVLGLTFEHQNPNSTTLLKPTADLASTYNLTQEQANEIKKQYTTNYTNYTTYDKSSIMVLDIPRNLLVTASTYTPANKTLSQTDINFIKNLYTRTPYGEISSFISVNCSNCFVRGEIRISHNGGEMVGQLNISNWGKNISSSRFNLKLGDKIKIDYKLYFSKDGKTQVTKGGVYAKADQGIIINPYLDTNQAGALVSESDTFYVTPVNTRFAINIMELKTW